MGRIRLKTLTDYQKHGYDLDVWCRVCGHRAIIVPATLFAAGILSPIDKLEQRLKCSRCRDRHAVISPTASGPSGGRRRGRNWQDHLKRQGREPPR